MYPTSQQSLKLQQTLSSPKSDSILTKEELNELCKAARLRMRQKSVTGMELAKVDEYLDNLFLEIISLPQQEANRNIPSPLLNRFNAVALSTEVQVRFGLPRDVVYSMVRRSMKKHLRRLVTLDQRSFIEKHVQSSSDQSVSALCDDLEHLNLPRDILCALVQESCTKLSRKRVSREARSMIKAHVEQAPHQNVLRLCEELQSQNPVFRIISKRTLYNLVRNMYMSKSKRMSTVKQRRFVRGVLEKRLTLERDGVRATDEEHVHTSEINRNLVDQLASCPELRNLSKENLQLLVHQYSQSTSRPAEQFSTTKEQRVAVKQHVQTCIDKQYPISYDELQRLTQLPKSILYRIVSYYSAHSAGRLSKESRLLVKSHVERSQHACNVPLLCDELEAQVDEYYTQQCTGIADKF
eukprot:CAMPEP_0117434654 /NCGR_PEP_ID=MMETSP0759-20121206/63_1 /TAXON_ID=63605 /ORGANISM="Percolomonas cosmopolitus, Strain WS" /LENGTH=409 /DNA_ID=CAMNT_0005226149 /DNA_START=258 /DNA_END=1487 /DNA_ORIENTATION=+